MKSWRVAAILVVLLAAIGIGVARFGPAGSVDPDPPAGGRANSPGPQTQERPLPMPGRLPGSRTASKDRTEKRADGPRIAWRRSTAVGTVSGGRLVRGVKLPASGRHHFTWDPILERSPDRPWRRWGTDLLVRRVLKVARQHRRSNVDAPRVTVGDISRPRGGDFGPRFGLPGHVSHQNGLDVDVYYPRLDRAELRPEHPRQIDRPLAQDLVDRFVAAGAEYVFVGPETGLRGAPGVVQTLANHDDHMHVRFRWRG